MIRKFYSDTLRHVMLCTLCMVCFPANADWQPVLEDAKRADYREGKETFRIHIPPEVPVAELQKLALELDAIDITAMVKRNGEYAIFTPVQPLAPGRHELRVVEYADDGSILELGSWSFEVRQSRLLREYAVAADTQLTSSVRVADNGLSPPYPDRLQSLGSSNIGYSAASGNWRSQGQFDLLYNSLNNSQTGGRQLDNGEFLFSADNTYIGARVGHQTVGTTSLVMDNFRRRGISLQGRLPVINSRLSGFSLSSEDIRGFRHGLGIGNPSRSVNGVSFDSSPLPGRPRALYLSGTWLDGQGRENSGLVGAIDGLESGRARGSAWSLSADSQLFSNRLRLRGEYASTNYDFNTTDNLASDKDTAYSLLATFADTTAIGLNWNAGVENRKIGTFFKSLGNLALPSDRRLLRAFGGLQWSTLGLQASFEQQKDNVEDIAQLPRIQTDLSNISMNWAPVLASADSWLGTPSFGAAFSRQKQGQTFTPIGFLQTPTNNKLISWQAYATSAYSFGSLGVTVVTSQFRDYAGIQDDTDTTGIYFNGSVTLIKQRLSLIPLIRFDRTDDKYTMQGSTVVTYGLQTIFVAKPKKLDGSFDINLNRNQSTDDSINNDTFTVSIALNWHLLAAHRNRPGFDLGFSGLYNGVKDNLVKANTFGTYQAFLTLRMVLPARAGQAQ